jgi:hypothetical protein
MVFGRLIGIEVVHSLNGVGSGRGHSIAVNSYTMPFIHLSKWGMAGEFFSCMIFGLESLIEFCFSLFC